MTYLVVLGLDLDDHVEGVSLLEGEVPLDLPLVHVVPHASAAGVAHDVLKETRSYGTMQKKMNETLDIVLNDAKVYAETGIPSEVKKARIAKLEKKKQAA